MAFPTISSVIQSDTSGGADAGWGYTDTDGTIYLKATVTLTGNNVKLEVEVKATGTVFNGAGTDISSSQASGSAIEITKSGLANGNYHWRCRGLDADLDASNDEAGPWQVYDTAHSDPNSIDFTITV